MDDLVGKTVRTPAGNEGEIISQRGEMVSVDLGGTYPQPWYIERLEFIDDAPQRDSNFTDDEREVVVAMSVLVGVAGQTYDPKGWNRVYKIVESYLEDHEVSDMLSTYATEDGEVGVRLSESFSEHVMGTVLEVLNQ